ncbi:MAG: catechol 2,3-dioxygenase [Patiriisocius sp.]|jgi:catechol 2,3-dioxygenase
MQESNRGHNQLVDNTILLIGATQSLGHVVVRVSNLKKSEASCSLGNHHDFAISENKDLAVAAGSGLDHVAFKIGNTMDELREAKTQMEGHGLEMQLEDHNVSKSIYISDPDGNGIELYIDASDAWKQNPALVASAKPLEI